MDYEDDTPDQWSAPSLMSRNMCRWSVGMRAPAKRTAEKAPLGRKKTTGFTTEGKGCFAYVARSGTRIKVGITSNPDQRMIDIRARLLLAIPVVREASRDVEGVCLTMLGRYNDMPGEWVFATDEQALSALRDAFAAVGRYRHVDPGLTAEEARIHRISLASSQMGV